jgi:acetate---CoA ligase (ADP-forming)
MPFDSQAVPFDTFSPRPDTAASFGRCWQTVALARHAPDEPQAAVVVQRMVGDGVELLVGARNDPHFGTIIVVGLGGMLVEVMNEVSLRIGPVDRGTAREMLVETKAGKLLAGTRGKGPYDLDAAIDVIVALSRFACEVAKSVAAVEINPLIVRESGCGAVGVDLVLEAVASNAKVSRRARRSK